MQCGTQQSFVCGLHALSIGLLSVTTSICRDFSDEWVREHLCKLQRQSEQLVNSFEVPLKEFVRAVKSAKSVITDRSTALGLLQQVPLLLQCLYMVHSDLFMCTGISVIVKHAGVFSQRHVCKRQCQPETPVMHCLIVKVLCLDCRRELM